MNTQFVRRTFVAAITASAPGGFGGPSSAVAQTPASTLTTPAAKEAVPDADGFIRRWLLLEPTAATGLTDSAVQATVNQEPFLSLLTVMPRHGDKLTIGDTELTWRGMDSLNYNVNLFHFGRAQGRKTSDALFWAVTVVNSPREANDVRLSIGSNAASVWWVNGKQVIGIYGDRQTVIDDGVSKRLTLHKGPNIVRAAIVNGGGATDFCARFLDSEDRPVKEITVSLGEGRATPASSDLPAHSISTRRAVP